MAKPSVVDRIRDFNAGRDPERLRRKYKLMASDPASFLRGTCHLFYADLPKSLRRSDAPPVWLCGDLHFENVGAYFGTNGLAYFDTTDFDETLLGPLTWDLARFLTSLRVGRVLLGLSTAEADVLSKAFLTSYFEV